MKNIVLSTALFCIVCIIFHATAQTDSVQMPDKLPKAVNSTTWKHILIKNRGRTRRFLKHNCKLVDNNMHDEGFPRWWRSSLHCNNVHNAVFVSVAANDDFCHGLPADLRSQNYKTKPEFMETKFRARVQEPNKPIKNTTFRVVLPVAYRCVEKSN